MLKRYKTIINLVALSVIIYIGVDIFCRVIRYQFVQADTEEIVMEPLPIRRQQKRSDLSTFRAIMDRNIFGASHMASKEGEALEIEALQPTSLKIVLLGTVTGNDQDARAIIEETDKHKQGLYKLGDTVQNALIKAILRGKVVLRVGDKDEILAMEESDRTKAGGQMASKGSESAGSTITVSHSDLQESLKNFNRLLTQVRIHPHIIDGQPSGFMISRISPGSIFQKLGLRNGDVVKTINGKTINTPEDAFEFYKDLKSGSYVSLNISRGNEPKTINYSFR
jgi:general secretion pathway protein C